MEKSEKKLLIVLSIIVGIIFYTAGYFGYKTFITPGLKSQNTLVLPLPKVDKNNTSGWQTYRNEEYGFEVKFPSDLVLQKNTGEAYASFLGKLEGKSYFLQFGYVSQRTLNAIGASYCETYQNDSRCENFVSDNLNFLIDWNIETEAAFTKSRAEILKPRGGMVEVSILHSPTQNIKSFFRQILSTFKFIDDTEDITIEELKNAEYYVIAYGVKAQLKDGHYSKFISSLASSVKINIYNDKIAFGDLNNDGKEDTAVILTTNMGGTGNFRELAVMINQNAKPVYTTSQELGDRVVINSINIESGEITLNMIVHGQNDGMCCPSQPKLAKYRLSENKLIEVN